MVQGGGKRRGGITEFASRFASELLDTRHDEVLRAAESETSILPNVRRE